MDARSRRTPPSIPGYRVERALGEGGMATAWLAVQESLGREVALKVLDPLLAADAAFVERFVREARVLASLRHRHIVAIHDVGLASGLPYLAMEYLGQGSIVPLCGRCDAATALRCVREIADALGHAHARGIIHRDVKPENILRGEDGDFVLGDFGIARVSDGAALAAPTAPGLAFGTPAYMAPERWRDGPVDGRSDFYSLGCVLHALLTARPPFEASEQVALGHKHLSAPIPLLPTPFEALQGLLARLLAKDPADRHPDAASIVAHVQALERELGADGKPPSGETRLLAEWPFGGGAKLLEPQAPPMPAPESRATSRSRLFAFGFGALAAVALLVAGWLSRGGEDPAPPPAPAPKSPVVAVLPFTAEGDDADLDRLADVLSEDLTAQLARQAGVQVVARTSVLAAPSTGELRDLAQRLGAERLVVGEMALSGQTLELALRIVDARTGMARWRGAVAGQPDRLWQLESRAVQALATDLLPGRTPTPTEIAGRAQDAYPDYLRGRKLLSAAAGEQMLGDAVKAFESALSADPGFAPALAGICRAELRLFEQRRDSTAYQRAGTACDRAVALDATLAEVVLAQGDLARLAGDPGRALAFYKRIEGDPVAGPDAMLGIARALDALDRIDDAERAFMDAQGRMPGFWRVYFEHGNMLLARGRAEEAIELYRAAERFAPQAESRIANNLGTAYLNLGRFEEATVSFEAALLVRRTYSLLSNLGTAKFYVGDFKTAVDYYSEAIALAPEDYRPYANLADAQWQLPAMREAATENYRIAADRAEKFLAVQSDSLDAATELAWYWVNLGELDRARRMAVAAVSQIKEPYAALRIAGVFERLGERQRAGEMIVLAKELGAPPRVVAATPWLSKIESRQ